MVTQTIEEKQDFLGQAAAGLGLGLHEFVARVDVINGLVSARKAREAYGVAIDPRTGIVDDRKMRVLRAARRC